MTEIENRETSVVAASLAATVLAAIYWISRIGFINPAMPVVETLGVALFLVAVPFWIARAAPRQVWWTSQSVIAIACIAFTMFAGILAHRTGVSTVILFAAIGLLLSLVTFVNWLRKGSIRSSVLFLLGATVFTVWCAGVI